MIGLNYTKISSICRLYLISGQRIWNRRGFGLGLCVYWNDCRINLIGKILKALFKKPVIIERAGEVIIGNKILIISSWLYFGDKIVRRIRIIERIT